MYQVQMLKNRLGCLMDKRELLLLQESTEKILSSENLRVFSKDYTADDVLVFGSFRF